MNKYIDSEKLIAEIRQHIHDPKQIEDWRYRLKMEEDNALLERIINIITSLQQEPRFPQYDNIVEKIFGAGNLDGWERDEVEMLVALAKEELLKSLQQEQSDIKSPFTGGKVVILSREEEVTFRGEKVKILRKYYRCVDTGREFTDSKLDDDMMWAVFRAYCEKKGITSFTDIMLKQEQSEVPSGEDVMTMCNQILIDWVKEGKTQEEKEQREQAHIRFFELYDDCLMQEQPEVDLEKFTEKIKTFQERYKYPEIVSIKGAMAFMARMFYQYPNVARQWYDSLPKATMD